MKLGLICVGAFIDTELALECLKPWAAYQSHEIKIAAVHGVFPSVWAKDKNVWTDITTRQFLSDCEQQGFVDKFVSITEPTLEKDLRNIALALLEEEKEKCDVFLIVDYDEVYTTKQIDTLINFISNTSFDWYKINFKNFVFDRNHFCYGFNPPRIWRRIRNDGIELAGFYHDNDIIYKDQKTDKDINHCAIPTSILCVDHYSWHDPILNRQKISHHLKHYGCCSYKWNEEKDCLEFNLDYYKKLGLTPPEVFSL